MSDLLPFVVAGLTAGSVYGLAGTGLVLTYKTSGIFNFAHGSVAALTAYVFYDLREQHGLPWPVALALCLLVFAPLVSLGLERIARRVAVAPAMMKVVATVGLLVGLQQLIVLRYGASNRFMQPFLPTHTFRILGVNVGADQLIVMGIALAGMLALTWLFVATRLGRSMTAVVDQPDLLALTGTSPVRVRRSAWFIGTAFAGLSGILLAPTVGLDPVTLTLLVVQAFGAAALGMFTSIPLTYAGGLVIGVLSAISTKYVTQFPTLNGVPSSLPFIVLFIVLVAAPRGWLTDFAQERKPISAEPRHVPVAVRVLGVAILLVVAVRIPYEVGFRLPVYTSALAFVLVFLSLLLLMRTSGQVSLAQLAFGAIGAVASAKLVTEAGLPWLLAVPLGALVAVPVGALLAIPAIRRSGLYLALATYGFAVLLERLVIPTKLMFGGSAGGVAAPRPGWASGDRAYFYVVLAFVLAGVFLVMALHRSRLGRLLRAMSDSPTALTTYGTSVVTLKIIVFCAAAFLAALGGALMGPVTGQASPGRFVAFNSLMLVVMAVIVVGGEVMAAIGASIAYILIPSYISSIHALASYGSYLPLQFAVSAVAVAMSSTRGGLRAPAWLAHAARSARPSARPGPIAARSAAVTR